MQSPPKLNLLPQDSRISSMEYSEIVKNGVAHILVDVRPEHHFQIVALPNSLNIPLPALENRVSEISSALQEMEDRNGTGASLFVVCRRGNDSQRAVQYLKKVGLTHVKDIVGGMEGWAHDVDPNFPTY